MVVKFGGGVLAHHEHFDAALASIGAAARDRRLLVVPGGGPFADVVREVDRRLRLPDDAAHWMAVLAMDQYAYLIAAAVRGARTGGAERAGVVAVAYADADRVASLPPAALTKVAARAGADGLLIDTADKRGPGLRRLVAPGALATLVAEAHQTGLFVVLAGKLTADDLPFARDAGADIVGIRGAACDDGRTGRVAARKVRLLRSLCAASANSIN